MTWVEIVPTAALLLAVLLVPGWLSVRGLGVGGLLAVAAAPAVTAGALGVLSVLYGLAGLRWSLVTVLPGLGLACLVALACGRALLPPPRAPRARRRAGGGAGGLVAVGVLAGVAIATSAFAQALGAPDTVPQMHDSLFHLNGAELAARTGEVTPLGAMGGLYGDGRGGGFYPTVWHSVVVLGAVVGGVVPATNALVVVGVVLPWMLGVAALAHVAAPRRPLVAALAPVVAASAVVFPGVAVMFKGMYPFGLSVALTPATLALAAALLPTLRPEGEAVALDALRGRARLAPWLALAMAAAGVILAHSSGLAALGFLAAPAVVTACWRLGSSQREAGRALLGWATALAPVAALVLLVAAVFTVPKLRAMAGYASPEGSPLAALGHVLVGSTPQQTAGALGVAVLTLVGLVTAWRRARWLAWSWLVALLLFVAAAGPDGPLRTLTGFWYKSADRLESLLVTVGAVLGAWGALALGRGLRMLLPDARRGRRRAPGPGSALAGVVAIALVVLAVAVPGTADEQRATTAAAYQPDVMVHPAWATPEELDFIEGLGDVLPEDAVVVGDPMNGAAFVQVLTGRRAYIPVLGESALSADQRYLQENFHDLTTDPEVCRILREHGVEYYYEDAPMPYGAVGLVGMRPGFYGVDVMTGLELVASSGTAAVYRIEACD
ncbi:hypothetical protein M3148_08650 [Georgenia satyanarayanai]|uniref:DUF6541 family protein n=1 Tax=Georgenia satyanarayanai TaxID=860221 RepID=UPI00203AA9A2|nr:DUF6541 family protein [Georgenia satyanarayanai]MCM3661059.1 hypothetical protein [Georgenia satyanarayanai]